ncbi:hypothetical protein Bbelb_110350 [Branchiostoma belcheri]|nr:hypothetical protein Bbelb_110350 [Branchiostoma belcheri]
MSKEDSTQNIALLTPRKIPDLLALAEVHLRTCRGSVQLGDNVVMDGHAAICTFYCTACPWMLHGTFTSGILPTQYEKLCQAADIGIIKEEDRNVVLSEYKGVVQDLAERSMETSLQEEIAASVLNEDEDDYRGLKVLSDARHCWRKNAYNSDVVFLGHTTHRVIRHELVTKEDEPVSPNHEIVGTRRFYEWADARGLSIHLHGHDRNLTVNKFLEDNRQYTENGNDTWHATKNLAKSFAKVAKGTIATRGRVWHPELSDKGAGVKTHFYWAMKTCNADAGLLQFRLNNIVRHYQNDHRDCFAGDGQLEGSRCRTDPNYEPQRALLRDPVAIAILTWWIQQTPIYKNPHDYVHCVNTHYVESFNNSILQYHDKRIVFGRDQYLLRSHLSILDWHIADRRSSAPLPHLVDSCLPCSTKTPGMANLHPFTLEDDEEITFPRLRPLLSPSEISPIQSRGASGVRTATTLPGALPRTTPQVGPTPLYNQYAQSAYATGSFPGRGTVPTATSVAESNTHGTSPAGASYHQAPPPAMTQDTTNQQPSSDLRLKTRLPPTFNGTDDDFTLWLNKFDLYATSQKYTPEERAMALPTFLDHHALRFYLGLPRQARATYSTLTQRLATAFSKEHYIYTFRQSLQERTRQPGEPLIVFALDLRRLVSQAYPEYNEAAVEGLTLDYFFRGIDPTIRRRLREVQATTVDQAVKTATMLEQAATAAAWEANNAHAVDPTFHHPAVSAVRNDTSLHRTVADLARQVSDLTDLLKHHRISPTDDPPRSTSPFRPRSRGRSPFRSSDASRRSARSPSWDRTSRRPSSRDRDYHRPSSDRYRARSPSWEQSVSISLGTFRIIFHTGKRPSAGTTGRPPVDHSQARHASPTAHTTAVLDGHATRILIDTGSAISLISETLRDTIPSLRQSQLKPSFTTAKSVTGEPLDVLGVLDIHIRIGNYDTCHPVHIVRGADQTALLGWDFCVSNCVILNASRGTLTVGDEIVPLLTDTELIPQVCNASVCRITTVPPHAVMAVPVTLTPRDAHGVSLPTYVGMLEPRQHDDRGLAVARTIVTTDSSQAYAQVTNTTDKPVVLQPDTPMGSFWALQDDDIADCLGPSPPAVASAGPPIDLNETDLSSTQAEQLRKLLDNYSDVFSTGPRDRGRTNLTTHRIHTGDCPPIKQRPHRTPIHRQAEIHRQVDAMLADDVIERSQSPWASPVVLARKKDGSFRFCVDYRKLNQATIKDAHPLPRTDDVIDALSGAAYFTTLDMTSGYWQVDLDPADREKTAFTTGRGLYQFKVMAFGLTNAPSTFQRLVELLLAGLDWRTCLAYLDDIIVFSRTFQDHLTTLEEVFRRCRAANLKLNAKKCQFARPRVRFLGHVVSKQGIQPDPANTEKVRHWPTPTSTAEVRAFLGLASYYRKFVRNFAHIADPLVALTRKHVRFAWDDACQKAFDSLRAALVTPPVLAYPDFTSPLTLYTDASNTAIGAVLTHPDDLGEHVISYASKTLSKQERNWSTYDRELWAIVWSVRHYRSYLAGHHFTVITDHKPLVGLSPKLISHDPTGRRARWAIELSTYQFNITYRAGKSHDNADAMSRRPPTVRDTTPSASINQSGLPGRDPTTTPTAEGPTPTVAAAADLDISEVLRWKRHRRGRPPFNDIQHKGRYLKSLWHQYPNLTVKGGILYRRWRPASRLLHQRVAPRALVPAILREMHNGPFSGHLGPAKTLRRVYIRFYWPGMTQEVKKWCRACVPCATRATPTPTARAPLRPIRADRPFSKVAMDITELPTSKHGHRYCLVVQDFFTKYVNAYPLKRQDAATVANVLFTDFIREHGIPTSLHSDQGRQFEADTMRSLYKALGIEKTRTTAYHPQGDGLVERFNRTLKDMLSKYVSTTGDDWDDHLPHVLLAYNTSVHASTGFTPFFLTHGREANLPADVIFGPNPQASSTVTSMAYARSLASSLRTAFKQVRQNTRQASNKQKLAYDVDVSHKPYQAGERVWLHDPTTVRQKLKPKWKGPYTVIERLLQDGEPGVTYRIQDTKGRKQIRDHAVNLRAAPATNQRDTSNPPSPAANQRDASNPPSQGTGVTTRRGRRVRPPSRYDDFVANEHVDREHTSVIRRQSATNPRAVEGHRVLRRKTNSFKATIWDNYMSQVLDYGMRNFCPPCETEPHGVTLRMAP